MAYSFKVVREFVDKHDNKKYEVGDQFLQTFLKAYQ